MVGRWDDDGILACLHVGMVAWWYVDMLMFVIHVSSVLQTLCIPAQGRLGCPWVQVRLFLVQSVSPCQGFVHCRWGTVRVWVEGGLFPDWPNAMECGDELQSHDWA